MTHDWITHDETIDWIMRSKRCDRGTAERLLLEKINAGRISFKATNRAGKRSVWRVRDGRVVEEH